MKKIISQVAETAKGKMEISTDAFTKIYPALMDGRYKSDKNSLMKLVVESNPTFDLKSATSLYDKLAEAIEANRIEFFVEQTKLIDYNREYKAFISKFPARCFVNSNDTIHITIVTSANTKEAYRTGEENDIKLDLSEPIYGPDKK